MPINPTLPQDGTSPWGDQMRTAFGEVVDAVNANEAEMTTGRLSPDQLSATSVGIVRERMSTYAEYVDDHESVADAYAALVQKGGGRLVFTPGSQYDGVSLPLNVPLPTVVEMYGATIIPALNADAFTMSASNAGPHPVELRGGLIQCAGRNARGLVVRDHYGARAFDVTIEDATVGVLITDETSWSESSQFDNLLIKRAGVGIDLQTTGDGTGHGGNSGAATGSFGYSNWGYVHIDNIPEDGIGFRLGAGASFSNSHIGMLNIHTSREGVVGMQMDGRLRASRINASIEALAPVPTSIAFAVGTNVMSYTDFLIRFMGDWGTVIQNPANTPLRINSLIDKASGRLVTVSSSASGIVDGSGLPTDTQRRYARQADGTHLWGSGSAEPDTNLYRAGANVLATDDEFRPAALLVPAGGHSKMYGGQRRTQAYANSAAEVQLTNVSPSLSVVNASAGTRSYRLWETTDPGWEMTIVKGDDSANAVVVNPPTGGRINGESSPITLDAQGSRAVFTSTGANGGLDWVASVS